LIVSFCWDGKEEARMTKSRPGKFVQMALIRSNKIKISAVLLKENIPLIFWLCICNGSRAEKVMNVHTNPSFCRYIHHKEQSQDFYNHREGFYKHFLD
jgi:hypothetical protein